MKYKNSILFILCIFAFLYFQGPSFTKYSHSIKHSLRNRAHDIYEFIQKWKETHQ
jgi:hypothetical protein